MLHSRLVCCFALLVTANSLGIAQPEVVKKTKPVGPYGPLEWADGFVNGTVTELSDSTVKVRLWGEFSQSVVNGKLGEPKVLIRHGTVFTFQLSPALAAGGYPEYEPQPPHGARLLGMGPGYTTNRARDLQVGDELNLQFSRYTRMEAFRFIRRVGETPELIAPMPRERLVPRIPFAKP